MKKEENEKRGHDASGADNINTEQDNKRNSPYFNTNEQQVNNPGADRAAKTERSGAGQQQGSSGSPINS
jgi:hypothetical protein